MVDAAGSGAGQRASAVFIGEGSLLAQCADAFLAAGHEVRAVVTEEPALLQWARERGLKTIDPAADVLALLSAMSFQFLFSVVNLRVLPPALLALPRRLAVNYHDGPLPRYAGVHATSWALMRGEREHGITWHTMEPAVDTGAVLKQVTFDVGPRATALSLNAACYEAALHSFVELIPELTAGTASLQPQDEQGRSYFGRLRRPPAACVLDWRRPVHALDALVRALDFGPYENALGLPKLLCPDGSVVAVQKTTVLTEPAPAAAGTVLAAGDRSVVVAGTDGALRLERFATLAGARLDAAALDARGITRGARLPALTDALAERLGAVQRAVAKHEPFWVDRLAGTAAPVLAQHWSPAGAQQPVVVEQPLPGGLGALLARALDGAPAADAVALVVAAFIGSHKPRVACDIAFRDHALAALLDGTPPVFAPAVPFRVEVGGALDQAAALRELGAELARVRAAGTYALDVHARIPSLRAHGRAAGTGALPIAICIHDADWSCVEPLTGGLCVCVEGGGSRLRWADDAGPGLDALRGLLARFAEFAVATASAAAEPFASSAADPA